MSTLIYRKILHLALVENNRDWRLIEIVFLRINRINNSNNIIVLYLVNLQFIIHARIAIYAFIKDFQSKTVFYQLQIILNSN